MPEYQSVERHFQPERSILALPADTTVKFGPTKIHRVILNRRKNIELPHSEVFPEAKRVLVIGAGCSMGIFSDMFLELEKYDAILITHPMVAHFSKILGDDRVWVVDGEYQPISKHYYDQWADKVQLICRLGKEIPDGVVYKKLCFILPEDRPWNINLVAELVPEKPYSTGALAMWYALNKFGKEALVDMIGIDNDGTVCRYWQETRDVILKAGESRVKNLAAHMRDWEAKQ